MPCMTDYERSFKSHTNDSLEAMIASIETLLNDSVINDGYGTLSLVSLIAQNELKGRGF